jgi:hypothetical protein
MERLSAVGQAPSVRRAALRGEVHPRVNVPWDGGVHAFEACGFEPANASLIALRSCRSAGRAATAPDPFVAPYYGFPIERSANEPPDEPRTWRKDEYSD